MLFLAPQTFFFPQEMLQTGNILGSVTTFPNKHFITAW